MYLYVPVRKIIIGNASYFLSPRVPYKCILTRMRTSTFLSQSVNLIIVITARRYATKLLRERFIWGHVTSRLRCGPNACVRAMSPTLCQYGDRFEDFACIMPLFRPQRIVTMFIGCGLRERDVGTASQPASSHPVHPKGNILSPSLLLRRERASDIYASTFPFCKIVVIRRRFANSHRDRPEVGY